MRESATSRDAMLQKTNARVTELESELGKMRENEAKMRETEKELRASFKDAQQKNTALGEQIALLQGSDKNSSSEMALLQKQKSDLEKEFASDK